MIRGLIGKALRIAAHRRQYWRTSTWPQRARVLWYAAREMAASEQPRGRA